MDRGSTGAGNRLLHVDIQIDEDQPRTGILDLLSRLRPQWRAEDVQLKMKSCCVLVASAAQKMPPRPWQRTKPLSDNKRKQCPLGDKTVASRTFTEGMTNQLIGCYVGSVQEPGCVLVRLYGRMTELYVNRDQEVDMFQVFHAHGCGPQIYCSFQNGICYEFIRGAVLEDELLQQPSIYRLIAAELGRIHSIEPKSGRPVEPVLWKKMSHFLTLVQSSTKSRTERSRGEFSHPEDGQQPQSLVPSFETLSAEMESLRRHLSRVDSPTVLCHNDLLTKNIIYNRQEGTVKFIDYEYADYNYQAFDIGNHFNEFAGVNDVNYSLYPSQELQRDWLLTYLESFRRSSGREATVTEAEVMQLYVQVCKFSLASSFFWGLWAILQSHYSSIDFDFQRYAAARLNYYFEKKDEYFGLRS